MSITATELKSNLGKYLLLAATEDIFITKTAKLSPSSPIPIRTEWTSPSPCSGFFRLM